jgi:hypothetical protein
MVVSPKLGAAMTADQHIAQAAARAAIARSNGDEATEAYWTERVVRLSDEREWHDERERLLRAAVREALEQPGSGWLVGSLRASPGAIPAVIDDEVSKHRTTFDALKGSPDHAGHVNA